MLTSREATKEEIEATGLIHRIYVPPGGTEGKPLVVLAHGRAGDANVMWVFSKALERQKPVIVSPQAHLVDPIGGFSWWPVHEKLSATADAALKAERLAEVESGVLRAKDFIVAAKKYYGTNPQQTYMAGFSQGGALSATISLMQPDFLQGVAILSGFIPYAVVKESTLLQSAVRSGKAVLPPYFVAHGTEDPIIPFARAMESIAWLRSIGADITLHEEAVKHKVGAAGIKALAEWFAALLPLPGEPS